MSECVKERERIKGCVRARNDGEERQRKRERGIGE